MRACPLEEANAETNHVTIGGLNSFAMGSGTEFPVTMDFVDHCTQCQQCVPVCPVDIHRSRIVLWNKLKRPPEPGKPIQIQQGDQSYESSHTTGELAKVFSDHPILGCLGETEMIRLFSEARYRTLADREMLFSEGAYLDNVWFVLEGTLETGMATERNPFQSMVVLAVGNCVGETSVLADQPSEFGARSLETTTVMGLSKYSLKSIMSLPTATGKEFKQRMENLYASKSVEAFFIKQPAFKDIPEDVVQQVVQEFAAERYLPGNLILSGTEAAGQIGIVKRGFVKEVRLREGREVVSNYLQVGDALGAIESDKSGSDGAFLKRGELIRYEAGTAAEVLTANVEQLRKKFPVFASILTSRWKTEDALRNGDSDQGDCPIGHDGIIDLGEAADVLHATKLLVINTATCVDCDNCVSACQRRHGHARLDRRGSGRQIGQFQIPASCFHCEDPVCLLCNVDGIVREPTGEIRIKEDNCIGCRGCAERCPYDNIQMVPRTNNDSLISKWLPDTLAELIGIKRQDPDELPQSELIASKCDLCAGKDGVPACVRSCPTGAAQRVDPIEHFLSR
jgi:Fe-S-cluster-containing hydrogenase component 2/CRP-like cAMP-binding protein